MESAITIHQSSMGYKWHALPGWGRCTISLCAFWVNADWRETWIALNLFLSLDNFIKIIGALGLCSTSRNVNALQIVYQIVKNWNFFSFNFCCEPRIDIVN